MSAKKIFVSYSRSDKALVERLVTSLREEGLEVWYDTHIRGGDNWEKTLKQEIKQADIMLMVLSKASVNSENVSNEMHYAKRTQTHIIPLRIEDCEPPLGLASAHQIDFSKDYDLGYQRLVADIKGLDVAPKPSKPPIPKKKTTRKRFPWLRTVKGKVIGVGLLILLTFIAYNAFQSPGNKGKTRITQPVTPVPMVNIESHVTGRFVILGPNPGGVWASRPGANTPYLWHNMAIRVQNDCNEAIYVDSGQFRLYLSSNTKIAGAESFFPTIQGREYQTKRLKNQWLEPGKTLSGDLIFRIPEHKLSNGLEINKAYHILRYPKGLKCKISYKPY